MREVHHTKLLSETETGRKILEDNSKVASTNTNVVTMDLSHIVKQHPCEVVRLALPQGDKQIRWR